MSLAPAERGTFQFNVNDNVNDNVNAGGRV
mgnify:FL=1